MARFFKKKKFGRQTKKKKDVRLIFLVTVIFLFGGIIVWRLFNLQVINHDFYSALAAGQHEIYQALFPERGKIWLQEIATSGESGEKKLYPIATNRSLFLVYAEPRKIENPDDLAEKLIEIFDLGDDEADNNENNNDVENDDRETDKKLEEERKQKEIERENLIAKLKKQDDPYEPLRRGVSEEIVNQIKELNVSGIGFVEEETRFYPEKNIGSHFLGFVGYKDDKKIGQYGLEGYFNSELAGKQGFLASEKDVAGRWIPISKRNWQKAEDGADLILTIDRNIQFFVCDKLRKAVEKHGADGGSVIIMEPKTGALLAMCSYPDFDANEYAKVKDINLFNNPAIFYQYEPGSVFKAITIAAALDLEKITPTTTYNDEGFVQVDGHIIKNSDGKAHGVQTMTQVLEESLNTGAVFVVSQIGPENFQKYVANFGFGTRTGIEMDFEAAGDIKSLNKKGKIWSATASFGQGISVTPIQLITAFGAIANGGKLVKPYIVDEIRKSNGEVIKTEPKLIRQVISKRTATLLGGMLVSVVERGHGRMAGVEGFYVAGKTGTAQVPKKDGPGYDPTATIGSFVGFAPVEDPKFVMLVKIDHPKDVMWAESSAAPLFGKIAKYVLNYLKVPPSR